MTVEQIAIRQEVRQMLSEAGINKNTLKDMVKEVLSEEIQKACKQALNETDFDYIAKRDIDKEFSKNIRSLIQEEVSNRVRRTFGGMTISVKLEDSSGNKVTDSSSNNI